MTKKMTNKKLASEFAIGVVIAIAVVFGMVFFFTAEKISENSDQAFEINIQPKENKKPNTEEDVVCTMDAKQCADGSYVGRVAPDCEFAPCP